MSYSCTDFTDSILDALAIELDHDELDDPSAQADYALAEIARLQHIEKGVTQAMQGSDAAAAIARIRAVLHQLRKTEAT